MAAVGVWVGRDEYKWYGHIENIRKRSNTFMALITYVISYIINNTFKRPKTTLFKTVARKNIITRLKIVQSFKRDCKLRKPF